MITKSRMLSLLGTGAILLLAVGIMAGGPPSEKNGADKGQQKEAKERKIEEKDVPKAALEALKKLAAGTPITKFEEENEHGTTYYEGSWKGPHGNIDALVTADGAVIEIEEAVTGDSVPKAVMAAAKKFAGKDAELKFEKETIIRYEVKFKKGDKYHELVLTGEGRQIKEEDEEEDQSDDE